MDITDRHLWFIAALSYPSMCLLIAATHARTAGHDSATFEMLYETFRIQLRTSLSAPVQVDGGGIGMVKSSRGVLMAVSDPPTLADSSLMCSLIVRHSSI